MTDAHDASPGILYTRTRRARRMPAVIRCERCPGPIQRRLDLPVFGPFMQDTSERSDLFPDVCVACEDDIQSAIDSRAPGAAYYPARSP